MSELPSDVIRVDYDEQGRITAFYRMPPPPRSPEEVARHCFGKYGNCTEPPAYIWTGAHGGEYYLCIGCCAEWREQVRGIAPLEPVRIRQVAGERGGQG